MAVSKKPSLAPKPAAAEAPKPDPVVPEPVVDVPEGPEVAAFVNDTKDAAARKQAKLDEEEAEKARLRAEWEAERAMERKIMRRHMEWLRPGVDDVPRQTNLMLPNKLKMRVEHVCRYGEERTNMAKVVTALLEEWVRGELDRMNIDYD